MDHPLAAAGSGAATRKENTLILQQSPTMRLPDQAVRALEQHLSGSVIRPDDAAYGQTRRVWNRAVNRYPALIVQPAHAQDVRHAIAFARQHNLPIAVRSGGHSPAGYGTVNDGLVIDLNRMKHVDVDVTNRTATAESGLTWGEFNQATYGAGLATPGPDVAAVGLGGHTLGGGFGWLSRKHGLTVDNLLAAELVTADGAVITASGTENPDLFWALRGGGGNFGVVTSLQFTLHPLGDVTGGVLVYPATRDILRAYADAGVNAPNELTTLASVTLAPPLSFIPERHRGTSVLMMIACHDGDPAMSDGAFVAFRQLGGAQPIADTIGPVPYLALFDMTARGATHQPQAIRAGFMDEFSDDAIDAILDAIAHASSPTSAVMLRALGGAIARAPMDATAFSHRDKPLYFAVNNSWEATSGVAGDIHVAWTEALWAKLAPHTAGAYANFLAGEGPARVQAAYSPAHYARLVEIKRQYDPGNIFHLNANIPPAPTRHTSVR